MVGQSIVFEAASGDEIRLYNFGGQIYEDSNRWDYSERAWLIEFFSIVHSFNGAPVLLRPLECKKVYKAAYVWTYFIALTLNLSSASLVGAVVDALFQNGYSNFQGRLL